MKSWATCVIAALIPGSVHAANLVVMTHELRPFVYNRTNLGLDGATYRTVQQLMQNIGITQPRIDLYPFARAIRSLEQNQKIALFPVAKIDERADKFKWVGPLAINDVYFYKLKSNPAVLTTLEQFKSTPRIAVGKGNASMQKLQQYGFTNLYPVTNEAQAIKMLALGRVDAVVVGEMVMADVLNDAHIRAEIIENTGTKLYTSALYIAFSKDVSDAEINIWQHGLEQIWTAEHAR